MIARMMKRRLWEKNRRHGCMRWFVATVAVLTVSAAINAQQPHQHADVATTPAAADPHRRVAAMLEEANEVIATGRGFGMAFAGRGQCEAKFGQIDEPCRFMGAGIGVCEQDGIGTKAAMAKQAPDPVLGRRPIMHLSGGDGCFKPG